MKRILPVLSVLTLAVAAWMFYKAASRHAPGTPAPAPSSAVEAELRKEIGQLKEQIAALENRAEAESAAPARSSPRTPAAAPAPPTELLKLIEEKDRELARQGQSLSDVRQKLTDLEQQLASSREQQAAELKRRESEMAELSAKLDASTKASAQAQSDLETRNRRLLQLENDWRKQTEEARKQSTRLKQVFDDLDALARRREAFMNNIMQRYREATDLFRALSLRLDSMRDGTATAGNELSRIQNAISLAEEDMRQLRSLHTRAAQLQKDLLAAMQTPKRP